MTNKKYEANLKYVYNVQIERQGEFMNEECEQVFEEEWVGIIYSSAVYLHVTMDEFQMGPRVLIYGVFKDTSKGQEQVVETEKNWVNTYGDDVEELGTCVVMVTTVQHMEVC